MLLCLNVNAQLGLLDKKPVPQVEQIRERPLLVVVEDLTDVDHFKEEDHKALEGFYDNIKEAIEKVWTFSKDVRYVTLAELHQLEANEEEAKKYAYLYYSIALKVNNAPNNCIVLGLLENKVSTNFAFTPDTYLADLMFSLSNMQMDLNTGSATMASSKAQGKKIAQFLRDSMSDKVLYIDKAFATSKLVKKIEDIYEYDYEFVDKAEIDRAIVKKNKDVLFFRHIIRAQRPTTKTRGGGVQTSSMNFTYTFLYKASDLQLGGSASVGSKIDMKAIKRTLKLMSY